MAERSAVERALRAELGELRDIPLSRVTVVQGDTATVATGGGTIASRTATVVGNAVDEAARNLRDLVLRTAADVLEAGVADVDLAGEAVTVRGAPQRGPTPLAALVRARRAPPRARPRP